MAETPQAARSPTLDRVLRAELCSGCGLCAGLDSSAITMGLDERGFARPSVSSPVTSVAEQAIAHACPGAAVAEWPDRAHHSWGPIDECSTGSATDSEVRFAGSSGGMISALAIHALELGLIDKVVHIAANPDKPLQNDIRVSCSRAEVLGGAGSRYGPSPLLASIGALLSGTDRAIIIGKPCDISALRRLAQIDHRVGERFPYMLSFFCGGMPSAKGSDAIVRAMGLDTHDLASFRYRGDGWPGRARAQSRDGRVAEMSYERSWGDFLSGRVQYRCKICPDAVGGSADIACADAWYGGESGYPQFEERDGRSLVLTRTDTGRALLASALAAKAVEVAPLPLGEIDLMQPSQARRKRLVLSRSYAARLLLQPQPRMRGLKLAAAAAANLSLVEQARGFFGSVSRIIRGRR